MQTVANTILSQLGHKFRVMTGAKNFVGSEDSLTFKIGQNAKSVTHVEVKLRNDLYDVRFTRVRGLDVTRLGEEYGIYADQLAQTIGDFCGLAISL